MRDWKRQIGELIRSFSTLEKRRDALREIDRIILDGRAVPKEFLGHMFGILPPLLGATRTIEVRQSRGGMVVIRSEPLIASDQPIADEPRWLEFLSRKEISVVEDLLTEGHDSGLPYEDSRSRLVVPYSAGGRLKGAFIFENEAVAAFSDKSTVDFANIIHGQLALGLRDLSEREAIARVLGIYRAVFEESLNASQCLALVLRHIRHLLEEADCPAEVQILCIEETGKSLVVAETTGLTDKTARLSLENSFCGRVFREGVAYRITDPRREPEYQGLLRSKEGHGMRSELAVLLAAGDEPFGILNIESERVEAFGDEEVSLMTDVAKDLGPVLSTIHTRVNEGRSGRRDALISVGRAVHELARDLRHSLVNPVFSLSSLISELQDNVLNSAEIADISSDMRAAVQRLEDSLAEITEDVANLANFGAIDLNAVIARLAEGFEDDKWHLQFSVSPDGVIPPVFATPLIRYHLECVLQNAADAIAERLIKEPDRELGHIALEWEVITLDAPQADDSVRQINERVRISIVDDGIGADDDCRKTMFEKGVSSKGSMGQGLHGAKQYLDTIGGKISCSDDVVEGCKMVVELQVYNAKVHGYAEGLVPGEVPKNESVT